MRIEDPVFLGIVRNRETAGGVVTCVMDRLLREGQPAQVGIGVRE